jgi:hypothetical protein
VSRLHDLVTDTVANRLFRAMRVTQVSDRGPFREISLTSVSPRDTPWTPGDKIQVRVAGGGLTMRTYTPVRWENTTGDTTILVYLHGAGPGSAWAQDVAAGDTVQVVGPRRSIDLTRFTRAPIFVGDETSVGVPSTGPKMWSPNVTRSSGGCSSVWTYAWNRRIAYSTASSRHGSISAQLMNAGGSPSRLGRCAGTPWPDSALSAR